MKAIRKRAEMSLAVVVSAIIVLVVLVVLIYIFTSRARISANTFGSCGVNGGQCILKDKTCTTEVGTASIRLYDLKCDAEGNEICCSRTNWLDK